MPVLADIVTVTRPLGWTATVGPLVCMLEQPDRHVKEPERPVGGVCEVSVTLPVKVFCSAIVMFELAEEPWLTEIVVGFADIVKSTILIVMLAR
jgi:hypothetical protein